MTIEFTINLLNDSHIRKNFYCGIKSLDEYIRKQANQDIKHHVSVIYVMTESESNHVVGYYTLSSYAVSTIDLPETLSRKLPRYPILPATLIGRLAVDAHYQGNGFGHVLLIDALKKAFETSHLVASFSVIVDAINKQAKSFYLHYGFLELSDSHKKLYLPMKSVGLLMKSLQGYH